MPIEATKETAFASIANVLPSSKERLKISDGYSKEVVEVTNALKDFSDAVASGDRQLALSKFEEAIDLIGKYPEIPYLSIHAAMLPEYYTAREHFGEFFNYLTEARAQKVEQNKSPDAVVEKKGILGRLKRRTI
ncbi:MAG: hypothetical protein QXR16_03780 [Candidatus Micrarchaeaceae archaeon]